MGSIHLAYCGCGFEAEVSVGGSMQGGYASFPHYCKTCGLVDVNMVTKSNQKKTCPKCKNLEVTRYGTPELSTSVEGNSTALQYYSHIAQEFGNFCPNCLHMTLVFDRMPSLLFD